MKINYILIIGSVITIILIILWYLEIIGEPIAALGGAILTLIGYILSNKESAKTKKYNVGKKSTKVTQIHSGTGDNIGGDKIINN